MATHIRKGWIEHARFNTPGFMGEIPGMSAVATWMMKGKMEKANIPALPDLQEMAALEGIALVACQMTVDRMKLKATDFIEGVTIQTAEEFLKQAVDCKSLLYT